MNKDRYELLLGEAAQWSARLAAPDCSEIEQRRFEKWLVQSSAHRAAFEEVQCTAEAISASMAIDPRLQQLLDQALAAGAELPDSANRVESLPAIQSGGNSINRSHSLLLRRFAAAAGVACLMIAAWTIVGVNGMNLERDANVIAIEAPKRSARLATLPDGTRVHVDAGAKLIVSFSPSARRVELAKGRAYFEVAHDASRPFSVTANGTRTVALGTKFEVQRQESETVVTLAEGSVAVSGTVNGATWQQRLSPGEQLDIGKNEQAQLRKVDAQEITSWSRGWLVFRGTPLVDALQEINRYSVKQVVTADDSLLALNVAGSFVAGDAQSIVDAIAEVLPIRVVDGGNREIILFKRYDSQ
jgi:transmembrane sensor